MKSVTHRVCGLESASIPSSRHSWARLLVAERKASVRINLLNDLNHTGEQSVHLDHCVALVKSSGTKVMTNSH